MRTKLRKRKKANAIDRYKPQQFLTFVAEQNRTEQNRLEIRIEQSVDLKRRDSKEKRNFKCFQEDKTIKANFKNVRFKNIKRKEVQ